MYYAVSLIHHGCGYKTDYFIDVRWITSEHQIAVSVKNWLVEHSRLPPDLDIYDICNCRYYQVKDVNNLELLRYNRLSTNQIILEPIYENYYYIEGITNQFHYMKPNIINLYRTIEQIKLNKIIDYEEYANEDLKIRAYVKELEDLYPRKEIEYFNKYLDKSLPPLVYKGELQLIA